MTNIARDGAPKKSNPLTPHNGMHHRANGKLTAGISKTEMAHPRDDSKQVHKPRVAKHSATNPFVKTHDAHDVAITPHGRAEVREGEGKAILDEAEAAFKPRK